VTRQGLFENERDSNRASTAALIELALRDLGQDPEACRTGAAGTWQIAAGDAPVQVSLVERDDYTHLRVTAPVFTVGDGAEGAPLFSRLLELNAGEVYGAAFAMEHGLILLVAERTTVDLDRSEVLDLLRRMGEYARRYASELALAFGV
jgi:hypothetical protein